MASRKEVTSAALDLAWSHWAELGVSGWTRRHSWQALDLEPLIIFTAYLGDADPRLREEALDWCLGNSELISTTRLKNLLRSAIEPVATAFGRFAATARAHGRLSWPGEGKTYPFAPTGRSHRPDLTWPAAIQLRIRAVAGVSARAEILRLLLASIASDQSTAELAAEAAYRKGQVAAALDLLVSAGIVEQEMAKNQQRFRLGQPSGLVALLGNTPSVFPNWAVIFRVVEQILDFYRVEQREPSVRAVAIAHLLKQLRRDLERIGSADTIPAQVGQALNQDFDEWSLRTIREWAQVAESPTPAADPTYTVDRLTSGSWIVTVTEPGEKPRPMQLPEWTAPGMYEEAPRSDMIIADDSIGAPRVAHLMMRDALVRTGVDIGDYWSGTGENQLISRAFAEERLWPIHPGGSMSWSADFIRKWYRDRKERLAASAYRPHDV